MSNKTKKKQRKNSNYKKPVKQEVKQPTRPAEVYYTPGLQKLVDRINPIIGFKSKYVIGLYSGIFTLVCAFVLRYFMGTVGPELEFITKLLEIASSVGFWLGGFTTVGYALLIISDKIKNKKNKKKK